MYDLVFVTQIPAFYKVNLYNEIAKEKKILVVFIGKYSIERSKSFINKEYSFDTYFLSEDNFESISSIKSSLKLMLYLNKINYEKIILSGWNLLPFWSALLMTSKKKNCLALESSFGESQVNGIKGFLKKVFLSKISLVYASGDSHSYLLKQLDYKNRVKKTRGVGLINYKKQDFIKNENYERKFLFIGRLVEIKNVRKLVELFTKLSEFHLTIVGDGPLREELTRNHIENITFNQHVDNNKLFNLISKSNFLILPSSSEPWGLVVEESLSCQTPVIVSRESGASELIDHGKNGFIFDSNDFEKLESLLLSINNKKYKEMKENIPVDLIAQKDKKQVQAYIE